MQKGKNLINNKRGSIIDIAIIIITVFAFAFLSLIGYKINDSIKTEFAANDVTQTNSNLNATYEQINGLFPTVMDNSILILVVGLAIVAFAFATMVRIHPVFFVFYAITLGFIIFIGGIFAGVYNEIASRPEFVDLADDLIFTDFIMTYLPIFVTVIGTVLSIIMYKLYAAQSEDTY